jgi:hypothetical protein
MRSRQPVCFGANPRRISRLRARNFLYTL